MEERTRILLCEDDESLGMLLREYLQQKGFSADLFADGESGYKAFLVDSHCDGFPHGGILNDGAGHVHGRKEGAGGLDG